MPVDIEHENRFVRRHIGPGPEDVRSMLRSIGCETVAELVRDTVPEAIRLDRDLDLPDGAPEHVLIRRLREIAARNRVLRSYIGMGYSGTITPLVILRNVLENPGWYTQYTPYQAEIAQGRLEALLNFQTAIIDLTGLDIANASLLDEATAAAEAMTLCYGESREPGRDEFFVADDCHPHTIDVIRTRAAPVGIEVSTGDPTSWKPTQRVFGALLQYPSTDGSVRDPRAFCDAVHEVGGMVVMAADLLALTLLTPPGDLGADIAVGNSQRFGVPLGFGGPHAAFMAAGEAFKRKIPGRIIGVSVDADGNPALRMALQTREQHIRREKATSNICTAQVLLAIMAGMYAVYHGPDRLRRIAERVRSLTAVLAEGLRRLGYGIENEHHFDTITVAAGGTAEQIVDRARERGINVRAHGDGRVGVALDETAGPADVDDLFAAFAVDRAPEFTAGGLAAEMETPPLPEALTRSTAFLEHPVFNSHHSETDMLRYMHALESRDLSLNTSMIPLGSCTMKLNATAQMAAVSWPEFGAIHPFVPRDQAQGYREVIEDLERWLAEICGFSATSLQPNSGAQGEYAGLQVIRAYHMDRAETHRDVCLIPSSAHGTNPASAVMAGLRVVVVRCDEDGNIDVEDLRAKATEHAERMGALMVTYPSTHGVFEERIREICAIVHENGGLVYLDGANLNAQVGLSRPGDYGADVCHINLHKTFSIPHGGGGPGMGPICVTEDLAPFLPGHALAGVGGDKAIGAVSAAPWGSASILLISWAYIALLGRAGVKRATEIAILNANYMATRLKEHFDVLYKGARGRVAHEFILDLRPLKKATGVTDEDVAKRLIDYGFHAPTMSFPVIGTIMIEPTESESKRELDRFCDALISIRSEIRQIELGLVDREDNPLKHAPHTAASVTVDEWSHGYSREQAAFPAPWTRENKFWPAVRRVNNAHGDRHLVCSCPPLESYVEAAGD